MQDILLEPYGAEGPQSYGGARRRRSPPSIGAGHAGRFRDSAARMLGRVTPIHIVIAGFGAVAGVVCVFSGDLFRAAAFGAPFLSAIGVAGLIGFGGRPVRSIER